jgi:hypothetical protein
VLVSRPDGAARPDFLADGRRGCLGPHLEDGKASAEALELLGEQWQDGEARDLSLIHLLPELTDKFSRVVSANLRIDKLTIVDGGEGEGLTGYVNNLTGSVVALLEQLENATGIDVAKTARGDGGGGGKLPRQLGDWGSTGKGARLRVRRPRRNVSPPENAPRPIP